MKKKNNLVVRLASTLILPVGIMIMAMSGDDVVPARSEGPCDIYAAKGCPCVAAHSTTRALYAAYNGPLYQVMRESDGKTLDIGIVAPVKDDAGGYADALAQDAFCANNLCWITKIYDQSGKGNHLLQTPPGTFKGPAKGAFNTLPIADMAPITISGHKAYGVYIMPGMGLRNNNASDIAVSDEPEGIYYVINGKHFDSGCCFDYGNSSTNGRAVGTGTMETTYYGTSTAWGSGNGAGPWIMADMEAGLFSGYNAKKNDVPSIDSWRFVSAFVDGGGGNKWDLRGGDAQKGNLTTFYSGVRPGTPGSNAYYPMNKKGGILLGNGGDNGNGSAGTFYEGVMTLGFPTEATTDAVQANIVAARYDVQRVSMSRITTFTPQSKQDVTISFTNTTGSPVTNVTLSIVPRKGWTVLASGSASSSKTFADPIAPNASMSATFSITSPATTDAGFLNAKAEWKNSATTTVQSETTMQRVRNVPQVKINEVRFGTGNNLTNQFIELYNASNREADISNLNLVSTSSGWAPVKLGTIPAGTKLAANGFYLFGLSASGLVAPASVGANVINVQSTTGFEVGQQITIDEESTTIANIGTPASPMTTLFIPVSTGPWLTFPVGTTTLPVTSAAGFLVGEKIGIDMGGKYEVTTVKAVGKAATQANLSVAAKAGDLTIKVSDNVNMTVGDVLTINTGSHKELVKVKRIINVVTAPLRGGSNSPAGEIELTSPLKFDHVLGVDVSDAGTGITFSPATRFAHKSGDAVQALGSGITLKSKLTKNHQVGASVDNTQITTAGYQGAVKPNQWFGIPLSAAAGSIALTDASGAALVDGIVYGSQQSNSSANGTIASPEIATLEGDQSQGGCQVVVPGSSARGPVIAASATNKSAGRFPDGNDSDSNCRDFQFQTSVTLSASAPVGSNNVKVAGVAGFAAGQNVIIGSGANSENVVISTVGTSGATKVGGPVKRSTMKISVNSVAGFGAGQTITIGSGEDLETAVVASAVAAPRRFGAAPAQGNSPTDSITVTMPLRFAHGPDTQVSGSGITLSAPLTKAHDLGEQVTSSIPTPGAPNQYVRKP